ncbi:BgTH12-03533 [Blumeria graminis f. sp. triticale]|uniref:Bgt-4669 n=4 Tax=Blumeria graminis TaxID=34373 RepID=A0A9X9L889_BLUGR|nr:BgTH12-03533 [Blumeria graminis f. sp. triticale]VCU39570.1 Bgt-4669 [Blumeria graminis f. sp. tritici]
MPAFFSTPSSLKKRKRPEETGSSKRRNLSQTQSRRQKPELKKLTRDESISGSDYESDNNRENRQASDELKSLDGETSGDEETAAERRLKLAERYLENIRTEVDEVGFDAEEIDRDLIAERLVEDVAESKGLIYRKIADTLNFQATNHSWTKWNSDSVTSVATCYPWAYTVTEDLTLIKWKIQDLPENQWSLKSKKRRQIKPKPPPKRKLEQVICVKGKRSKAKDESYQGHSDKILCVAASQDGKFVVTGGKDRKIIVWDAETLKCLRVFTHHRDWVTGLVFRRGTNQLYSSSKDRTVKIWSLNELAYVETLFGHQDEIVDISALAQERCISVGARDRTARLWKVAEETQLVFRGGGGIEKKSKSKSNRFPEGSIDRVAMIDEEMFVTGSDNGSLSLWATHKKKPLFTLQTCHGVEPLLAPEDVSAEKTPTPNTIPEPQPRWITALTAIPYSDVVLSGSWDGSLRVWRVSDDKKKLEPMGTVYGQPPDDSSTLPGLLEDKAHTKKNENSVNEVRGIINDISVFERGERGKDGVCIIAAVGKQNRLGRWQKIRGKNGAIVFEVPRLQKDEKPGADED